MDRPTGYPKPGYADLHPKHHPPRARGMIGRWLVPGLLRDTLPLTYAARCKRNPKAGLPFLLDNFGDDLLIVLIAFALFSAIPFTVALSIFAFHISFWAIYEAGYVQNDAVALEYEVEPKLPPRARAFQRIYSERAAWIWAALFGLAGAYLAAASGAAGPFRYGAEEAHATLLPSLEAAPSDVLAVFATWIAALAALRGVFHIYNHVDKTTRIYFYLPLQLAKYGFPVLFFVLPPAGAILVFAQVMRRWMPYLQYRLTRHKKDRFPARLVRLTIFAALWLLLLPQNAEWAYVAHGGVAMVLLAARARSQLREAAGSACWVHADTWRSHFDERSESADPVEAVTGPKGEVRR